jgi:hypothetical protein
MRSSIFSLQFFNWREAHSIYFLLCLLTYTFEMDSRSLTLAEEKELETGVTSSPHRSLRNEKTDLDDTQTENEDGSIRNPTNAEPEAGDGEGEYPSGIRMTLIVVSLMLSIFLVSAPLMRRRGAED